MLPAVLAVLLALPVIGWVGEQSTSAAAPAQLISVNPQTGGPFADSDDGPSVSGDGNIVLFTDHFVIDFPATQAQLWVRDRAAGVSTRVPVPPGVADQTLGVLSRNGCKVAFWGFVLGFPASQWDIFLWDRCANTAPVQISTATDFPTLTAPGAGIRPLSISADGRFVAYGAVPGGSSSMRIARIDTNAPISEARLINGFNDVNTIDISDDGKFVAAGIQTFVTSSPTNEVIGWTPPCITGVTVVCNTEVISVAPNGAPANNFNYNPSVSADGRFVAFASDSTDLGLPTAQTLQVYVRDRVTKTTKAVTDTPGQPSPDVVDEPDITPDGSQIALSVAPPLILTFRPGVNTDAGEVFVARSIAGFFDNAQFDLVSFGVSGAPTSTDSINPSISATGRFVAFASGAGAELSGNAQFPQGFDVWMRDRPISLDITPTLDFGTIDVGAQSPPQNAIVRNTSNVNINIASVAPPAAPFAITNNACTGPLAPGATCAITIVFTPTAGGSASSSVTVAGDGLSVATSLVGVGRAAPPPTNPTIPGSLVINPTSADFGSGVVGTPLPSRNFTVTNPGQTAVPITGVTLNGGGADQFAIIGNSCSGALGPGANCTITVRATPTRVAASSAQLRVTGSGGQSAQATLRVRGLPAPPPPVQTFNPVLRMNPGVVHSGAVTTAVGSAFPPDIDVQLAFAGEAPFATVHTDGTGAFRFDLLILPNDPRIGGVEIIAIDQPLFSGVRAPLLIDLATYQPAGIDNPALTGSGVLKLVTRGG